jgi:hypothetical protein
MASMDRPRIVTHSNGVVNMTFTPEQVERAMKDGAARQGNARKDNRIQRAGIQGTPESSLKSEGASVLAEYAVAYYFEQWDFKPCVERPDSDKGDVFVHGKWIEVKSTPHQRGGLIVFEKDKRVGVPFVLVIKNPPVATIIGWHVGSLCKKPEFWRDDWREPNYCVPQNRLFPIHTLRELLTENALRSA